MVKEKPNSTRTYDDEGYRKRAACLCFKDETEKEVLLVSSSSDNERYIIPGGGVEPKEDPCMTAVREVLEEAGVKGELGRLVGMFQNQERNHRTLVYALVVSELLEEWEDFRHIGRKRKWFRIEEAKTHLSEHKPVQVKYLDLIDKPPT